MSIIRSDNLALATDTSYLVESALRMEDTRLSGQLGSSNTSRNSECEIPKVSMMATTKIPIEADSGLLLENLTVSPSQLSGTFMTSL